MPQNGSRRFFFQKLPFQFVIIKEQKFGDPCQESVECNFLGGHCDPVAGICKCLPEAPVSDFYDKCGRQAKINESCTFDEQCSASNKQTMCKNEKCACRFDLTPIVQNDGSIICSCQYTLFFFKCN